ncbi:unnamed protein product [Penicillium nalgiovense]|nr:unnamed protein product [Penicillium nalgiovense]CAG8077010.1 unnamed protein product [Penicillium nalgiovense]CAG8180742.1 unnamed protein product [Penicillium nalgiovense]CAG8238305.1 unnamed protein product [Penicillium nalgiovense]CAG8251505.1 unnamed protein product [Penicillium nalgiovense]
MLPPPFFFFFFGGLLQLCRYCTCSEFNILTKLHVVAMTRPKRHLCICGDSETISHFLKHWMDFLEENADLRYPDAGDLL